VELYSLLVSLAIVHWQHAPAIICDKRNQRCRSTRV